LFRQLLLAFSASILVSAFCGLCEAILLSISPGQIEALSKSGKASGHILSKLKNRIHQPITAILILNTIASTAGAAITGALAAKVFGEQHLILFSAVFTLAILVCAEILPKTLGVSYGKSLAGMVALPIKWITILFTPLILIIQSIMRLLPTQKNQNQIPSEEILALVSLGLKSGHIEPQEERVIKNILSLKDKSAWQIMTPRTVTFSLSENLNLAQAKEFRQWNLHSRVPVYGSDPDDVVGIVLRKDLLLKITENQDDLLLSDIMQPVHFIPESIALTSVLLDFFERHQHLFAVVDEYGAFTGVISLEDVIEEIVGREIMDETDKTMDMRELARKQRKGISG
jgi:CBS domain containing-hemolysin-like protein